MMVCNMDDHLSTVKFGAWTVW